MGKITRRNFLKKTGITATILVISEQSAQAQEIIQGFDDTHTEVATQEKWQQKHDRKIKVGIAGYGLCQFGAVFGFQDHPNVEVVAVTDLVPERCQGLSRDCRCEKTYPSLEEMVKDDQIEAIFCATDAPHHAEHCILALNHGKHVATAVPAVFNSVAGSSAIRNRKENRPEIHDV
jgi:uncharacterized protein (DUF3084 family)